MKPGFHIDNIKASFMKIADPVEPAGTDGGVFLDLNLLGTASTTGDIVQIVP